MVEKLMERDYFLDAHQALEMGLVDKVLTSRDDQDQAMAALKGANHKKDNDNGGDDKGDGDGGQAEPPSPAVNPSPS
jgi:hypothetical protein